MESTGNRIGLARALLKIAGEQFATRLPVRTRPPDFRQLSSDPTFAQRMLDKWQSVGRDSAIPCGQPYTGNYESGSFRRKTDPHPHALVVIQVCRFLADLGEPFGSLFWWAYVNQYNPRSFPDGERLMDRMAWEFAPVVESWGAEDLVTRTLIEWRMEKAMLRREKKAGYDHERYERHLEKNSE